MRSAKTGRCWAVDEARALRKNPDDPELPEMGAAYVFVNPASDSRFIWTQVVTARLKVT